MTTGEIPIEKMEPARSGCWKRSAQCAVVENQVRVICIAQVRSNAAPRVLVALTQLPRAPKAQHSREQFGGDSNVVVKKACEVLPRDAARARQGIDVD